MNTTTKTTPNQWDDEDEELLRQAEAELMADFEAGSLQSPQEVTQEEPVPSDRPSSTGLRGLWDSVGAGIARAGIETKDFIFGEPEEDQKSDFRKGIENRARELQDAGMANSAVMGISQIAVGLVGAGKLMAPIRGIKAYRGGTLGFEVARGGAAGAVVLDPHEERLADLIEQFPSLQNPVTAYLASDPEDSAAEGRFKNALEGIGLDLAVAGIIASSLKAIRYFRNGDNEKAIKELAALEKQQAEIDGAMARNREEFGLDFADSGPQTATGTHTAPSASPESPTPAKGSAPLSESPRVRNSDDGGGSIPTSSQDAVDDPVAAMMAISLEDYRHILKGTGDDLKAIAQYGSREAAAEAGQIAARSASRLPWQKLQAHDGLMEFIDRSAKTLKADMDKAKGGDILKDQEVADKVRRMADYFGDDPATIMGELAVAGEKAALMTSRMEAAYLISNRMFQETYETAFKLRNGSLEEWGGDATKAAQELKDRLRLSTTVLAAAQSMRSNAGRTMRRLRGQFQPREADLAALDGMDANRLADVLYSTKGDPAKLAQVANPTFLRRVTNEANFLVQNNLLWLWTTHAVNLTSNALMLAGRPTEKLLGGIVMGPKQGGDILRRRAIEEYSATVAALGDAWTAAVEAFKRGDSALAPHNTEYFQGAIQQQSLRWKPVKGIMDLAENAVVSANYRNIVGLPTRALGAADEFFKTLRYRAYVQGQAASRAHAMGLTGQDYQRYLKAELERSIDPATGRALDRIALQEAQLATFQNELLEGTAGATIQQARNRHPLLTQILPFVKTPVNVLRYGWKMTPGLNMLQKEFRTAWVGRAGPEAQAHAMGQMALGSLFMGLSATMVLNGRMTGGGPRDPKRQAELRATGWQPYSYVIEGEDGSKTYINMGRTDPVSMSMGLMADLVDLIRHDPENSAVEDGMGAVALSLMKSFTDRTFLQNLNQTLEALSDEDGQRAERWLGSVAGNLVPLSSLQRGINPDPYMREARGFLDNVMKNVPGFSETLPPRRDVFGETVWRRNSLVTDSEADEVEAEHNRIMLETGNGIGSPDPKFEGLDLRDITLESGQNAYDRLQELSAAIPNQKLLKHYLSRLINSKVYQDMPDGDSGVKGTRLWAFSGEVTRYRQQAKRYLVMENKELQPLIKARQRAARGAYLENTRQRREGQSPARAILDALNGQQRR